MALFTSPAARATRRADPPTARPPGPGAAAAPAPAASAPVLAVLGLALALLAAALLAASPDVQGVRQLVRATARSSLALYLLAAGAGALAARWPSGFTGWLAARRQAWGLGLALSHAVHGVAVLAFARLDPAAFAAASGNPVPGLLAYAWLAAMALSSAAPVRRRLGERVWFGLQRSGLWVLGLSFAVANGKRVPLDAAYALPLALLAALVLLRAWPRRRAG